MNDYLKSYCSSTEHRDRVVTLLAKLSQLTCWVAMLTAVVAILVNPDGDYPLTAVVNVVVTSAAAGLLALTTTAVVVRARRVGAAVALVNDGGLGVFNELYAKMIDDKRGLRRSSIIAIGGAVVLTFIQFTPAMMIACFFAGFNILGDVELIACSLAMSRYNELVDSFLR